MADNVDFIDIHSHILYGIDDGARDVDEALDIINMAGAAGVRAMVATPHITLERSNGVLNEASTKLEILKDIVRQQGIGVDLTLGAEVILELELPMAVKKDKRLTIGGKGRHILVEMPLSGIPMYAGSVIFDLLANGITPVWAHPERCFEVIDDYKVVFPYVRNGVLLQINVGSLLGFYGRKVKHTAKKIIVNNLGHVLASDMHRCNDTRKAFPDAFHYVVRMIGNKKAVDMVFSIPSKIIN